jgi:hypothetical protein
MVCSSLRTGALAALVVGVLAPARADVALPGAAPAIDAALSARCRRALGERRLARADGANRVALKESPGRVERRVKGGRSSDDAVDGVCFYGMMSVPEGTLVLPPGWLAIDVTGMDSRPGRIVDERDVERLQYDIGPMAGAWVPPGPRPDFTSSQDEMVAGTPLRHGLRKGRFQATIGQSTNFFGGPHATAEDAVILTFLRSLHR